MSSITKVALAGATGNLGPAILEQLLAAGFHVKVLTRQSSSHKFPDAVEVAPVDYDSLDSLAAALEGQDAVVSTLASLALEKQQLLVEAASKAGVKRFIPSEFGSNTVHEKTSKLPSFGHKIAVQEALKREATKPDGMTYTIVVNGPFLDWGVRVGWLANLQAREINLWDGGDRVFSTTTLTSVGKAVAGVLQHPAETRNRAVYVQDAALSARDLARYAKKATGDSGSDSEQSWKEHRPSVDEIVNAGWAELKKENPNPNPDNFVMNFITASVFGEGYGSHFEKNDNELLGLKDMSDDEIVAVLKGLA
ncbi:NAD(P)-binding protein [Apiospora phragmitis]|uniref:NAD(P)-binding protein n=1 Tax=Apiospora phragmitis TaxID=2905665 RepID=A0ABR1TUV0_9PEZI